MPDPRRDEKGITQLRRLLRAPKTVAELRDATGLSESTVYRWFRYLEDRGVTVVRRGPRGAIRFSVAS